MSGGIRRGAGRPKLPNRVQITVTIERTTRNKLLRAAILERPTGKKRIEMGKIIDQLAELFL